MNRANFFSAVRASLFAGKLSAGQVEGMEAILDAWTVKGGDDERWLAYMLATTYHETARTMQPVRETLAATDEQAAARLESAWRAGRLPGVKTPYWHADAQGKIWIGRGLVQLTHRRNYEAMSKATGIDLVADPARAMQMPVAIAIMFAGMSQGMYTGRKLADYFAGRRSDWVNARRIINGTDRAGEIADYGREFAAAIRTGSMR